ncbi:MAG: hypothetical protein ABI448_10530, partial [Bacteroidia bacterium]
MIINISFTAKAQAPPWQWAKGVHSNVAEFATDVSFDPSTGNLVTVGIFNSDLSTYFGSKFIGAIGGGYVAKYDPTGAVIWAFPIGNNQDDACKGVTVDVSGNIYVTGYLQQIANFKGMSAASTILTSAGGKDIFLAKYNSAGQLLWVTQAGGTTDDEGTAVCVTANGVYITGYYTGQANFGAIQLLVLSGADQKAYTAAYDVNGNSTWATTIGNSGSTAAGVDICADNSNVFITGNFEGSSVNVYDAGLLSILSLLFPSATLSNSSASSFDGFTASFTAAGGIYNWSSSIHSNNDDFSNGITQTGNNLYITGATSANANFTGYASNPAATSANGLDMFVAQLSKATGNANWVKSETGNNDQQGMSIAVDTANLLTVSGYFNTAMTFSGTTTITSSGNEDVFVAAYNLAGTFAWVNQAGDNGTDIATAITTGGMGEIYTAGQYEKNAVFGSNTLTQDSPPNIFLAKIGCPPITNNLISATQTVCTTQTPTVLAGTAPLGGNSSYTYLWQQSADNTTWVSASGTNNTQNYSPALLAANTYYQRIVTANNGCNNSSTSTSILITVNQLPTTAVVSSSQTVCATTATLSANNPTVGTGVWSVITGTATVVSPSSYTTSANGLSIGQNSFVWMVSNGICASSSDTLIINSQTPPIVSISGTNTICIGNTTTLTANGADIYTWNSGPNTASYTVAPTGSGTIYTVTGTNTLTTCSNTSTISVTVDAMPSIANAGSDQNLCSATSSTLAANNPTVGTGVWFVIAGTTTLTSSTSSTTSVTGLGVGQNSFVWTISNGVCASSSDTISIQVDAQPTIANAGINQALCAATTTTLLANNPSVGNGAWSVVSGTANIVSPTNYSTSINSLGIGETILMWTISNGVCASSTSTISITNSDVPSVAVTAGSQTICANTSTISANNPTVGTGVWSVIAGTSTLTSSTSSTTSVTGLSVGQNSFVWTISNGVCAPSSNTISIQVDAQPTIANAGSNQTFCAATTATLGANNPTIGNGVWSTLTGTSTVTTPTLNTSGITGLNIGQNAFIWTISNGTCASSKDTVAIQIDDNPTTALVASNQTLCASTTTISANNPIVGTGLWSVITGTSTIATPTLSTSNVSGLNIGQNNFIWTISNGVCPISSATLNVQVDENPSTAATASN